MTVVLRDDSEVGVSFSLVRSEASSLQRGYIGFAARLLAAAVARKDAASFWDIAGPVVVAASTLTTDEGRGVAEGDMAAIAAVIPYLSLRYGPESLWLGTAESFSSSYTMEDLRGRDLVLIGGPLTNSLTEQVLPMLRLPYEVNQDHSIMDRETEIRFLGSVGSNSDYGLIVRAKSPFDRERRVFILMGTRAFGTTVAGCMVSDPGFLQWIHRRIGSDDICLLVKGERPIDKNPWPVNGGVLKQQPVPMLRVKLSRWIFLTVTRWLLPVILVAFTCLGVANSIGVGNIIYGDLCIASAFLLNEMARKYILDSADLPAF